jgi:hypothetical protein
MRFLITMNMPSSSGRDVHSIIGDQKFCSTVDEFMQELEGNGYIVVEEFFVDKYASSGSPASVKSNGDIGLNFMHVGKVKLYEDAHLS